MRLEAAVDLSGGRMLYPPRTACWPCCASSAESLVAPARMNDLPRLTLLEELDARQDELLAELDRLNLRLEQVIGQCLSERDPPAKEPLAKAA